jgi:hypothetical protein
MLHETETLPRLFLITIGKRKVFLTAIFKGPRIDPAYVEAIRGRKTSRRRPETGSQVKQGNAK